MHAPDPIWNLAHHCERSCLPLLQIKIVVLLSATLYGTKIAELILPTVKGTVQHKIRNKLTKRRLDKISKEDEAMAEEDAPGTPNNAAGLDLLRRADSMDASARPPQPRILPDEMPPSGGFILPETLGLACSRSRRRCQYRRRAILY